MYGDGRDWTAFREEDLPTALAVSDIWDGVSLLNPQIVSGAGEWAAWCYVAWPNGIGRWRSCWELMNAEHHRFLATGDAPA